MVCERLTTLDSPVQMLGCLPPGGGSPVARLRTWNCPICHQLGPSSLAAPLTPGTQRGIEIWRGTFYGRDWICLDCGVYAPEGWADPARPEYHRVLSPEERAAYVEAALPDDLYESYVATEDALYGPNVTDGAQELAAIEAHEAVRLRVTAYFADPQEKP